MNDEDKELVKKIKERYFNILDTDYIKECYSDIGKLLNLVDKEYKIIDKMAEELTTPIHDKEWIINYYLKEIENG